MAFFRKFSPVYVIKSIFRIVFGSNRDSRKTKWLRRMSFLGAIGFGVSQLSGDSVAETIDRYVCMPMESDSTYGWLAKSGWCTKLNNALVDLFRDKKSSRSQKRAPHKRYGPDEYKMPVSSKGPANYAEARAELHHLYYINSQGPYADESNRTLYCGCPIVYRNGKASFPLLSACNYLLRRNIERATRIEWEHMMPAHAFGSGLACWGKTGGRKHCQDTSPEFNKMEADMHNLAPSVGEVNADRSNFRYGMIASPKQGRSFGYNNSCLGADNPNDCYIKYLMHEVPSDVYAEMKIGKSAFQYGACQMVTDFSLRISQPPPRARGTVARAYKYMEKRYGVTLSSAQRKLFDAWDRQYPPGKWECERNRQIKNIQGNDNPFVTSRCRDPKQK